MSLSMYPIRPAQMPKKGTAQAPRDNHCEKNNNRQYRAKMVNMSGGQDPAVLGRN